jgi:SAM-dependent methyltransferase
MIIPQPIVAKIPGLLSNEDIRLRVVLGQLRGRVLDVGCGKNLLINIYRQRGGAGVGVDVYPWEGVDVVVEDSARLFFSDGSFDTVSFVACFNHIPNREDVLREAYRVLSPGGRVVVTNLPPIISRIWHAWNHFWSRDQKERGMKEGEVWGFRRDDLIKIFCRNGFQMRGYELFSWGLNQLYIAERIEDCQTSFPQKVQR